MAIEYAVEFPDYFDEYADEIKAKGYFADLVVSFGGRRLRPTFYDRFRFDQECDDAFAGGEPFFTAPLLIVLPEVTRERITAAIDDLAAGDFAGLVPEG